MVYSPEGGTVLTKALSFYKRLLKVCNHLLVKRSMLNGPTIPTTGTFICRSQGYDFYDRLVRFKSNILARST